MLTLLIAPPLNFMATRLLCTAFKTKAVSHPRV